MIRRKIEELLFLHSVEPSLRDIIVEGDYDQHLVSWFVKGKAQVWRVADIEVDDGKLLEQGRKANNRERVLLVAELAEEKLGASNRLLCIYDRDYDDYFEARMLPKCSVPTDGTCIEALAWDPDVFDCFLKVFCGKPKLDGVKVLDILLPPLKQLFALRLAAEQMTEFYLDWIDADRCLEFKGGALRLDQEKFVTKLLQKAKAAKRSGEYHALFQKAFGALANDARMCLHGHDFTSAVNTLLRHLGADSDLIKSGVIARALALAVAAFPHTLSQSALFTRIGAFCSA